MDAYLAKLLGPGFKLTHRSFEMEDMTIEFDDATQCYKIPGHRHGGLLPRCRHQAVQAQRQAACDRGLYSHHQHGRQHLNVSSDTPTKYMDYLFERQSGSWYLTGLTESETKAESTESTPAANVPEPMAESDVQDAILAAAGSDSASAEADSTAADEGVDTQAEKQPADSTEAQADESTASPAA